MSISVLYLPYKLAFEPIVRIGEYIAIPGKEYKYYRVLYVEPVQPIIIAQSLEASQRNVEYTLDELELQEKMFGQWRMWVLDFVAITFKYPRAVEKYATKTKSTQIIPMSMAKENILEFYTIEDKTPTLYLTNPVAEAQSVRLVVWGFKYALEEVEEVPPTYTVIPIYSLDFVIGGRRG